MAALYCTLRARGTSCFEPCNWPACQQDVGRGQLAIQSEHTREGGDVQLGLDGGQALGHGSHLLRDLVQEGPPVVQLRSLPVALRLPLRQLLDLQPGLRLSDRTWGSGPGVWRSGPWRPGGSDQGDCHQNPVRLGHDVGEGRQ